MVVAGPGVLAARGARALRTLAGITGATVVNTVGAKGVFAWDDPLHGGTIGLQVDDPTLAEITSADLVVTTGLDPAESASLATALAARAEGDPASVVDIHPAHLALAAGGWPPADGPGPRPPIYDRIAAVVGPMYGSGGSTDVKGSSAELDPEGQALRPGDGGGRGRPRGPGDGQGPGGSVSPPQAARGLADALAEGGLVVAPPGPTGFWLGRTFPTSVSGSVIVTTGDPAGTAEAVALEAARSGRPVTLVVADREVPSALADGSLPEVAAAEALPLVVEVWADPSLPITLGPGTRRVTVDWSALDALVHVAGEPDLAIWPGP